MDEILSFIQSSFGLSDATMVEHIQKTSYTEHLNKNQVLIQRGELPKGLCFLLNGMLRGYLTDFKGKDITDCFGYQFGTVAMPYADMMQPSPITIAAMAPSTIYVIPTSTMKTMLAEHHEAVCIYNKMLLAATAEHWEIKTAMHLYSAEQRYQWFLKRYPNLIDRIPHKHIASFLGMSPVTLSRVRRALKEKEKHKE